mgnify:CR=1 FL=1
MKKIIALALLALMTLCSAEELKVTTLEVKKINYQNGSIGGTVFRVVCINGYKWLQKDGEHGSISQMFQNNNNNMAKAIPCNN